MKKLLACVVLAAIVMVGCGGKDGGTKTADGKDRVVYYTWDDPSIKVMVDAFNASQNEIFVEAQYLASTDYETRITTLLAGRTAMDAFMQKRQPDMFAHYNNGFIEPLDSLLASTGVNRIAVDNYINSVSIDGKVVAFPWRGSAAYVYFNKKIFRDKGVPTPDVYVNEGTWTWDKFAEVAQQISSGDGNIFGASVYFWGSSQLFKEAQNQRDLITADGRIDFSDSVQGWFSMRKAMEGNQSMWPLIDMRVSATHYSKQFYDGRVGMLLMGEWFPGQIVAGRDQGLLQGWTWESDWGITRLPSNVDPYVTPGAPTFNHVVSYAKNKEAALKFIAWMGGPEGARLAAEAGVLPAMVDDGVKEAFKASIPDPQSLEFFVEDKIVYSINYNRFGPRVEGLIERMMDEYLLGKIAEGQFDNQLRSGLQEIIDTTN